MEKENVKESSFKKVLKKKEVWISALIGLIIGAVLMLLLAIFGVIGGTNETIATFKGGKVTGSTLYKEMKKYYPISYVLELVDAPILEKKYELTDEQEQEIIEEADSILLTYETYYGYTEEEFLTANGFDTKDEFLEYLRLDYRRNLYCIDYFKTLLDEAEIQEYYDSSVYGEINTKHILVQISDDVTEEDALALANEIIEKLNAGSDFDSLAEEYAEQVVLENVDFDNFTASSLETAYVTAALELDKDTYTSKPVLTDFGYHIIYIIDKQDKPAFEDVENDIVDVLGESLEDDDPYIRYKALIQMREENNVKFVEDTYKKQYEEYCTEVNG